MRHAKYSKLILFHFILPISFGGLIYLIFRPMHLYVFYWVDMLGLNSLVLQVRDIFDIAHYLPAWIIYSLPNGLWAYSFMFFISFVWGHTNSIGKTFFIILVVILSVGSELGQLLGLVPGTFCLTDVVLYLLGLVVGYNLGLSYSYGDVSANMRIFLERFKYG